MPNTHNTKNKVTKEVRRKLTKLSKIHYKKPLMMQDGFQMIEGKVYKEYILRSGRKLPKDFNEENEYSIPCYESYNLERGGLYNELLSLYKTKGMNSVDQRIGHIEEMQKLYEDVITGS